MRLSRNRIRFLTNRTYFLLYPEGSPKPFWVDKQFLGRVRRIRWMYVKDRHGQHKARGYFGVKVTRQYLHRFVLTLAGKHYPSVTFENGDEFDCRLVNLRPYTCDLRACRPLFRNSTTGRKGVSFHKGSKKWIAHIRVRGKLRHLGYHPSPDAAARAYARAWNLAYPHLPPVPVT